MKISTLPRVFRRRFARIGDKGLTLIELLIVITILSILAAIVFFSARDVRGQATSAASSTDVGVIQSAQAAYCYANGTYASPMSALYTPPNNELTGPPTYNGSVVWSPEAYSYTVPPLVLADDSAQDRYLGYRAGGALSSLPTPAPGCGGQSYTIGPLTFQAGSGGPGIMADPDVMQAVNFLGSSFTTAFGAVNFIDGTPSALNQQDYLSVTATTSALVAPSATSVPPAPLNPAFTYDTYDPKVIATGHLTLLACRAGGTAVPAGAVTPICQAPFNTTQFLAASEATLNTVAAALSAVGTSCGANPVLVIEDPTSSDPLVQAFGLAAEQALLNSGLTTTAFTNAFNFACIVYAPNLAGATTILRTGGATDESTTVSPAQYALVSNAATTSPVAVDTNWKHDPISDPNSLTPNTATYTPVAIWANVLTPTLNPDPAFTVQAARYVNYLLSPLGQATLAAYGFTQLTNDGIANVPMPEHNP